MEQKVIRIRDLRQKEKFVMDDEYMNGYARLCGWKATIAYNSLCRHANKDQFCFPSVQLMADENGVDRKTILKGISSLQDWRIIQVERIRTKTGIWKNNSYILLDKSAWRPKPSQVPMKDLVQPSPCGGLDQVPVEDTKETHIKETHIDNIRILSRRNAGNPNINELMSYLTEKMELPRLDLSEKVNRQYAWNLLRRSKTGALGVKWLIDLAAADPWFKAHITSFRDLWNNQVKIVAQKRAEVNKYVDITDIR